VITKIKYALEKQKKKEKKEKRKKKGESKKSGKRKRGMTQRVELLIMSLSL
jgi:hypothetical protein